METITSPQNPAVKLTRSLALKKHRQETGLFFVEGIEVLAMASRSNWQPHTLFVRNGARTLALTDWATAAGARCLMAGDAVMRVLSAQNNPSDAIAIMHQQMAAPPRQPDPSDVWIVLEDIRDPGNLGTIIRTCDAAGGSGVIVTGNACDPFAGECVRASMGSLFAVPLVRMERNAFAAFASKWPGDVIGTHMEASRDFRSTYKRPSLIMMGSEGAGLSAELSRLCTADVRIPMKGSAESLNVAIAAALMLYEVRRPDL